MPRTINCTKCGKEIDSEVTYCPHCGTLLVGISVENKDAHSKTLPDAKEDISEKSKNINAKKITAIIGAIIAIAIIGFFINSYFLFGDDKTAYNLMSEAVYDFKDPSSVTLLQGNVHPVEVLGDNPAMFATISAKNGFGGYVDSKNIIAVYDGEVVCIYASEANMEDSYYFSESNVNLTKVNKALKRLFR